MAFWGVEIKSGKPYILRSSNSLGRLHISQATLGTEKKTDRSSVQCSIGGSRPVLLCTLISGKVESLQLDLEFDEVEDVAFTVIGPRSIYLVGYYVSNSQQINLLEESEPEGEDIGTSDTQISTRDGKDAYDLEDTFINDAEESPKKKQKSIGALKRLIKKCESTDSADVEIVADSEEEGDTNERSKSKRRRRRHSSKTKDDETLSV